MKKLILLLATAALLRAAAPTEVILTGRPDWSIASGVALPAGRAVFWTSGTVPTQINKDGKTVYERYGDTYTQGVSCLKNIEAVLAEQGLTLKDVVYLRVYLTPDAAKDGKPDFPGWFKAYGEYFNNAENPRKTARSTLAVSALVSPDWLIEIEAFAAYPAQP
ncbi:Putative aminoacrylate peracid reductase RutC [Lacunisphaera limnophila]|uniref:Aminoacrylate peracid reductase RutC n=1 Tax=Lacunisphaera limnophila TaxID=1838286 RepID=A0A1D8ASS3_9BACT|nr:RidA family protein [Lacunisphaera limnophila]AOS43949.1 Putative aminoacrylate peracid reductase RutC [Lacunisphaera limnophila]